MQPVKLRDLTVEDQEWIFRACQDAEIQRFTLVPRPYTHQHAADFVETQAGEFKVWVVELENQPIGVIGIHSVDNETGDASIGYWIAPWGRRRGAASKAISLVYKFASDLPNVHRVTAQIATTNLASQTCAERAKFKMTKETTETCPDGGVQVASLLYYKAVN